MNGGEAVRVVVKKRRRLYDGFFRLEAAKLRFERFDGSMSQEMERLVFERGDSAAVLLFDRERETVTLVEQFRYPVYLREGQDCRLLEVVAGTIEHGDAPEDVARTESMEEAGYSLKRLEHVTTFYASPGAGTERIHLYLGYVDQQARLGAGGGLTDHGEDVRVVEIPLKEALDLVRSGVIRDGKTIIALQYLAARLSG
jgi:nudix-type nucleoside diphosphatase (YffH/AdpP family)